MPARAAERWGSRSADGGTSFMEVEDGRAAVVTAADDHREKLLSPATGVLLLGAVTVLWGAQHSTIRLTLLDGDALDAAVLNLVRFGLAAVCFSPWLPAPRSAGAAVLAWRGGAELGFWLFLGFCLQSVGLLYTTAQRSGLLLYLNVKLVPFLAYCVFKREVALSAWVSAIIAFFGTFLVAGDGAGGHPPNIGDALSLTAACASALFIIRLETFAPVTNAKQLNAVSTAFVAALCLPWAFAEAALQAPPDMQGGITKLAEFACCQVAKRTQAMVQNHFLAMISLGVVTTAFTNYLQTVGQRSVSATVASVIYALDPLWGCLFAYLWLGELLGLQGLTGCAVLVFVWLYQLALSCRFADGAKPPASPERTAASAN
mmetsp:Transcript_37166/g.104869  ORF Transcript_37166/g.104869 Transcript_37166/m.104869 type:complete len:374 (-) Transcript_37166:196-1317(-)